MKCKALFAGLAISLASSVSGAATCTSSTTLGTLGLFGSSFSSAGTYYDCFTFSLSGNAKAVGGIQELDPFWNKLNISLKSVSLFSDGTLVGNMDTSPLTFSFGNLAGGALYTLQVVSKVIVASGIGTNDKVGYAGVITTLASPAPEPAAYALAAAGLAIVGVSAWRRRRP